MKYVVLVGGFVASSCALVERHTTCADGEGTAEIFGVLECDLCASRSCCAEATACVADGGCAELMRCFRGCSDESCFQGCRTSIVHDAARAADLVDCVASQCETPQCPLPERAATCAGTDAVSDVFGRARCDLCIRRTLCDAAATCAGLPACTARLACMGGCVGSNLNPACFDQCRADGLVDVGDAQFFTAVARDCREDCAIGSDFTCVDDYAWPTTNDPMASISYRAINRANNQGIAGLEVTACANKPAACDPVGTPPTVTTDADGIVTVNVPTRNGFEDTAFSGFRGYFRWEDPTANRALWLPTILYHIRPDYRDRAADEVAPFASGELLTALFELIANNPPAVTIDATRGIVLGGVVDCHGSFEFFAHDVAVEIEGADAATRTVFVNKTQTLPDFLATRTTQAGQFICINVPTGAPRITLRHALTGQVVAETNLEIRADTVTILAAWPNFR